MNGFLDPGCSRVTSLKTRNGLVHEYDKPSTPAQRSPFYRWTSAVVIVVNTLISSSGMNAHAFDIQSGFPECAASTGVVVSTGDRICQNSVEIIDAVLEFALGKGIQTRSTFTEQIFAEPSTYNNEVAKLTIQTPTSTIHQPELSLNSNVQPYAFHPTFYSTNWDGSKEINYKQLFTSEFSDFPPQSFTKLDDDDLIVLMPPKSLDSNPNESGNAIIATSPTQQNDSIAGFLEFSLGALAFGGVALSFTGRGGTHDGNTQIAKVVMVQSEPYGLGKGRNWYNGVDITANKPKLANDVQKYCDAGQGVTSECAQSIAGYLETVTTLSTQEKDETTFAIISYLESLSGGVNGNNIGSCGTTKRGAAFSCYVEGVSTGSVPGPTSAVSVTNYLVSLANNAVTNKSSPRIEGLQFEQSSFDGYEQDFYLKREYLLSTIEQRVDKLESSVDQLPDELSSRLEQWQRMQDYRLSKEISEILSYLVTQR